MTLYKPLAVGNNPTAVTVYGNEVLPNTEPDHSEDGGTVLADQDQRDYSDAELLEEARKRLDYCESADGENRNRGAEMLRFCYKRGSQWPEKVKTDRENDNRPCLEINQMPAFINQVLNDERQNRPAIKIRPTSDDATEELAELRQDLIRHIEYDSNAAAAYDNAFRYAVVANVGYIRITTEYEKEDSFEQKICIKPISNPMSVYFDPDCQEPDGSDAEFVLVSEELTKLQFERKYPDAAPIDWQTTDPVLTAWLKPDAIRIADYLHKVRYKDVLCKYMDGGTGFRSEEDKNRHRIPAVGPDGKPIEREVDRCQINWEVINGSEVLERHSWAGEIIPVVPVFGDQTNIEGEVIRQGLVDRGVDQQQSYNYLVTVAIEGAALQPKVPWLVAEGSLDQREMIWGQANNKNYPYLVYRASDEQGRPLPPPTRISPDVDVQGMLGQASRFQQDMRLAIGIGDPLQQMQTQDQSGRAILAKERISNTSTYHFMDNLTRGIRLVGKVIIDLIPHIIDTQRTLQLLREDGTQYRTRVNVPQTPPMLPPQGMGVPAQTGQPPQSPSPAPQPPMPTPMPMLNDMGQGDYDVVVDVGPSYASKRVEFVNSVMDLTQANPQLWQVAGDLLVKNMDWPGAEDVADRLKVMLPPQIQQLEAQKSQDPQVVALNGAMQQMQQQFTQQTQALTAKMQELTQQNQSLQSQVYQGKASVAQERLRAANDDRQAQADVQTQLMESEDVRARLQMDRANLGAEIKEKDRDFLLGIMDRALQMVALQQKQQQPVAPEAAGFDMDARRMAGNGQGQ
jgi:hypothetical protein